MACNAGPDIIEDGLLISLDASNPRSYPGSGDEWYDLSGNDYHMSLKNSPSFTTFNDAACFDLDGSDDYGSCDGTILGSNSATVSNLGIGGNNEKTVVCVAVIDNGVGSSSGGLFDLGNAGNGRMYCLRLKGSYTSFRAQFWSTPDYDFNYDGTAIWTMFSVVYGSDKIGKTYGNDGVLLGNDGGSYDLDTQGTRPFEMARYNGGSYFGGKISQYLVYNRGLSPQEIKQNYQATVGRYS